MPPLERAVRIKAEGGGRDEREQDLRMLLNFGHSMGHAVETLEGYRGLLHGEAVSIGMVYASRLSETLGVAEAGIATRLTALCTSLGLPVELPGYSRLASRKALGVDKKRRDDRIHYGVLERIGAARTQALTPAEIVALVPRQLQQRSLLERQLGTLTSMLCFKCNRIRLVKSTSYIGIFD